MPHKHTRRQQDESTVDLPPTQFAKSLPVKQFKAKDNDQRGAKRKGKGDGKASGKQNGKENGASEGAAGSLKRKRTAGRKDDTPRAFKRLMAYAGGKKPRSGLDNGDIPRGAKSKKKGKPQEDPSTEPEPEKKQAAAVPKILPGERLSEFSARVDAALPLSGLVNKSIQGKRDPLGLKVWRTNKERKMHKLYDEWREEERKIKENREDELEQEAERELEEEESGVSWKMHMGNQGSGKRKKRDKDDEDPWAELRRKRGETRPGLRDVALAPPELTAKPSKKHLLVQGAAVQVNDIPKSAGSLKRREELQAARDDIITAYRKKMSEKRPSLHGP
ncbi:hypothetical protein F4808DRAFT_410581 [Astrocystis sublimbata]|nr:hypothetical protein F4808DRAFT_410581 [Astrocystis sublimbata]